MTQVKAEFGNLVLVSSLGEAGKRLRVSDMRETIRFCVVQEPYGWAVRMGEGVMTPFPSRGLALRHASGFAESLRQHGEAAEVVLDADVVETPPRSRSRSRIPTIWR